MKHVYLHEVSMIQGTTNLEEIHVAFSVVDLSYDSTEFYRGTDSLTLPNFVAKFKDNNAYKFENFYFDKSLPRFNKHREVTQLTQSQFYDKVEDYKDDDKITVIQILSVLSQSSTEIKYEEAFYSSMVGGVSYESFNPNFETAKLTANNLIISNKKFNVVLASTIDGMYSSESNEINEVFTRYVPFKLIKFGKLMHNSLTVKVSDANKGFLAMALKLDVTQEYVTINLIEYPVFAENVPFTLNMFRSLLSNIVTKKASDKGAKFYLNQLKESIPLSLMQTNEWFRGEKVDDDYLSDEGTDSFEVWIKGVKTQPSVKSTLERLGDFGTQYLTLIESISRMEDFNAKEMNINTFDDTATIVKELNRTRKISDVEAMSLFICNTLAKETTGTQIERYKVIVKAFKENAKTLNLLELKLLNLRYCLYKTCDKPIMSHNESIISMGEYDGGTGNTVYLESDTGLVLGFKKEVITQPTNYEQYSLTGSNSNIISQEASVEDGK